MKRTILNISALALIAGAILTSCNTADKKTADAGATSTDSTSTVSTTSTTVTTDTVMPKTKTKLDQAKVPSAVTQVFYTDYPQATVADANWYGYPTFDYVNDWYDYDPDLYTNDNPDAYVIEFTTDNVPHRVVYTKAGKRVASHTIITSELPAPVLTAISTGLYKDWTLGKEREIVFKSKDSDKLKLYKVSVKMGMERHVLYFDPSGKLIKDNKRA
jgi:hypothetical protein